MVLLKSYLKSYYLQALNSGPGRSYDHPVTEDEGTELEAHHRTSAGKTMDFTVPF